MNDYLIAIIRTIVPAVVGLLIAQAARAGFDIPQAELVVVVEAFCIGVYYVAVRYAESIYPGLGVLLGVSREPSYNEKVTP